MRTTLDLHDPLAQQAKAFAALQGLSLTRLIEQGLELRMKQATLSAKPTAPMPISAQRGGLAPGLSGLSTREILDYIDEAEPNAR